MQSAGFQSLMGLNARVAHYFHAGATILPTPHGASTHWDAVVFMQSTFNFQPVMGFQHYEIVPRFVPTILSSNPSWGSDTHVCAILCEWLYNFQPLMGLQHYPISAPPRQATIFQPLMGPQHTIPMTAMPSRCGLPTPHGASTPPECFSALGAKGDLPTPHGVSTRIQRLAISEVDRHLPTPHGVSTPCFCSYFQRSRRTQSPISGQSRPFHTSVSRAFYRAGDRSKPLTHPVQPASAQGMIPVHCTRSTAFR